MDLKIIAAVIIVILVIGIGFFANFGLRNYLRPVEEKFIDFFGIGENNLPKNVTFSFKANSYPEITTDSTKDTKIIIDTDGYEMKTSVGTFNGERDKIEIYGFRGSVKITQKNITLNGDFKSIKTNKMNITSGNIQSSFLFDSLIINDINLHELTLKEGTLSALGVYEISEKNISDIKYIRVNLTFGKQFTGAGVANKISISGDLKITISS
jgi:hypothetical protein